MYGDAVTYTCNPGYTMVGGGYVTCQANRQWTLRPTCVFHGKDNRKGPCKRGV